MDSLQPTETVMDIIAEGNNTQMKTDAISTETETPKVTKRKPGLDDQKQLPKKNKPPNQKNSIISEENSYQTKKDAIYTKTEKPKATNRKTSSDDPKQLPEKKKSSIQKPFSEMVVEAIKSLKMNKGAPAEAILSYLEENYGLDKKSNGRYVSRFLKSGCEKGIVEEVSEGRFKLKKMEKTKQGEMNAKEEKGKAKRGAKTSN